MAIGILGLGERQRVRLFVRRDQLDRFVACTLCLPRDRFNTDNRQRAGRILAEAFGGGQVDWTPAAVGVAAGARRLRGPLPARGPATTTTSPRSRRGSREATRAWSDDLRAALIGGARGAARGSSCYARFGDAFPPTYRADWGAQGGGRRHRPDDRARAHRTSDPRLYRTLEAAEQVGPLQAAERERRLAVRRRCRRSSTWGPRCVDERPYEITPGGSEPVWIYDFGLSCRPEELERAGDAFAGRRSWTSGAASSRTTGSTGWCWPPA